MGVSKNWGTPKWMVKIMGNPIKNGTPPKFKSEFTPEKWWQFGRRSGFLLGPGIFSEENSLLMVKPKNHQLFKWEP